MITELPTRPSPRASRPCDAPEASPGATQSSMPLVRGLFAFYLLPALLAVLVVGGVGILLLAARRQLAEIVGSHACQPRSPAGPESLRS